MSTETHGSWQEWHCDYRLTAYRTDLELEHHRLEVQIQDEMAVDIDGVTKEMFQLFFSAFAEQHLYGNLHKVPDNDHRWTYSSFEDDLSYL